MANFPGRNDRRRRVLNDEVLSASRSHLALRAEPHEKAEGRYGEAASVENHPQVSDFVPRRLGSIAFFIAAALVTTGLVGGLKVWEATAISTEGIWANTAPHVFEASRGIAEWIGSVMLFVTGLFCLLVHAIRKHRLDDVRGRYRIWKWACAICLLASANCVIGVHNLVSEMAGHMTGWTALKSGAAWWLVLGAPAIWVALRVFLDTRESRPAAGLLILAATGYSTAIASFLGWIPGLDASMEPIVTASGGLLGHWLVFAGVLAYSRHIVLDAQGLIEHAQAESHSSASHEPALSETSTKSHAGETARQSAPATLRIADATTAKPRSQATSAKSQSKANDWVDGSRRERDSYEADADDDEDSGDRKFSKTERKQLRKLKARNRAA